MSSKIRLQLRTQFDYTIELIDNFQRLLSYVSVEFCDYYNLPDIAQTNDSSQPNSEIVVEKYSDNETALSKLINSYSDFYRKPNLSTKLLRRHPGILSVNEQHKSEVISHITQINEQKLAFKKLVTNIKGKDARFEAVHDAIPNLITLAFYRLFHFEQNKPFSVRFTWMHKHSIKTLSKQDAILLLNNSKTYGAQRNIDATTWQEMVENEQQRVLQSVHHLKIRRPIKVSPQVNIRFDAQNRYHVSAALPFIIFCKKSESKIGELSNYRLGRDDARSRASSYLVDRLYLEQYK